MSSDDRQSPAPPEVTVAPVETEATAVAATELLGLVHTTPPPPAEPDLLVEGLRHLQQRIPEFTHLSLEDKRAYARAASLDPEFIESGLHAAAVWRHTEKFVNRTGDELRQEHEETRRWDEVIREMRALTDGIEAANVKRKHRLGSAILMIYRVLTTTLHRSHPEDAYMRPYYENMKRAYLRTRRFRRRTKAEAPKKEEPPSEE